MAGDIVFTDGSQNLAMTMTVPGSGEMQIRVVDGIFYLNLGETSQNKFVAIDPADESNPMASAFDGLTEQMDPSASVEALEGAIVSVEKDGDPVDIDGVKAQPYTVVVDTTKLTGSMKEQADAAGSALPETLTYQYWIDADDLMRKVVMDVQGSVMEMTFSNWGEDLQVVAPRPTRSRPSRSSDPRRSPQALSLLPTAVHGLVGRAPPSCCPDLGG
ncbi:hypothetical protein NKG05_13200 [Oerskovia sp. M15]